MAAPSTVTGALPTGQNLRNTEKFAGSIPVVAANQKSKEDPLHLKPRTGIAYLLLASSFRVMSTMEYFSKRGFVTIANALCELGYAMIGASRAVGAH
jgi:hypothetical protein